MMAKLLISNIKGLYMSENWKGPSFLERGILNPFRKIAG
jgi:hypothetical protein